MDSDYEEIITAAPKKRNKNEHSYKRNIIKKARVSGEAYVAHNDRQVPRVSYGSGCRCKRKCYSNLLEFESIDIFTQFHELSTKNEQDIFLQQNILQVNVARRQKNDNLPVSKKKPRTATFKYFVSTAKHGKVEICKEAFLSLYGVTAERIRRLCNLLKQKKLPRDQRGKHPCKHAISGEICKQIEDHIKSFPLKITHYGSKQVCYLNERLDVKQMHQLFKSKFPGTKVKYEFYLKLFKERFNLRFGRPQIDTCCTCESLNVRLKSSFLNDNAKKVAATELMLHKRRSKKFYHKLREAKEICTPEDSKYNNNTMAIAFDYMMNLQLPEIPIQETFYLRQLTVNVFCITNLKTNFSKFYVYHEGIAGKGPNEVTSFIDDYIKSEIPPNIKHLLLFSDSCGGQNKNHTLLRYLSALVELKKFGTIEQFYPVRGHSFLPCDRAFGCIKRKFKKVDRIYSLRQIMKIIISSSPSKFLVHLVQPSDIINFKIWWKTWFKKSCLSECSYGRNVPKSQKINFLISKYSHFIHTADNPGKIKALEYIDNTMNALNFHLRMSKKSCFPEQLTLPINLAYSTKKPINFKKIGDIRKLIPYVPIKYKEFYEDLLQWPTTNSECTNDMESDCE